MSIWEVIKQHKDSQVTTRTTTFSISGVLPQHSFATLLAQKGNGRRDIMNDNPICFNKCFCKLHLYNWPTDFRTAIIATTACIPSDIKYKCVSFIYDTPCAHYTGFGLANMSVGRDIPTICCLNFISKTFKIYFQSFLGFIFRISWKSTRITSDIGIHFWKFSWGWPLPPYPHIPLIPANPPPPPIPPIPTYPPILPSPPPLPLPPFLFERL